MWPVFVRELRAAARLAENYWLRVIGAGALLAAAFVAISSHLSTSAAAASAEFEDYIFFKPGGTWSQKEANISVTLGKLTWSCAGQWLKSSGITLNTTPQPSSPDKTFVNFPRWDNTLIMSK